MPRIHATGFTPATAANDLEASSPTIAGPRRDANANEEILEDVAGIAKREKKRKQAESIDHLDPTTVFKGGISFANNFTLVNKLMSYVWFCAFSCSLAMLGNFFILHLFISPYAMYLSGDFLAENLLNSTSPEEAEALRMYNYEQQTAGSNKARICNFTQVSFGIALLFILSQFYSKMNKVKDYVIVFTPCIISPAFVYWNSKIDSIPVSAEIVTALSVFEVAFCCGMFVSSFWAK